jgi:hypothetical protein
MIRFIGHSQVVTTNNYNTLKITVTTVLQTDSLYRLGADPIETPFILVVYCYSLVFTAPLPSTGYPLLSRIVVRVTQQRAVYQESVFAGTCLSSRCLAVGLYFRIWKWIRSTCILCGEAVLDILSRFSNYATNGTYYVRKKTALKWWL